LKTIAVIVNYQASSLTLKAAQSVLDSDSIGPVQVVVVDNSEDRAEAERLSRDLPKAVFLKASPKNVGFGSACNWAFETFDGEFILLLNPDARLLPGCLIRLQRTLLSMERVAAVAPQIYWDDRLQFHLPPPLPFFLFEFQTMGQSGRAGSSISSFLSRAWRHRSMAVWRSKRPVLVTSLSGGLMLLRRDAVLKAGRLFDPRFFLYFEDADLSIRLRKAGYDLAIEPRARGVHYYDGSGPKGGRTKMMLMAQSRTLFLEKHVSPLKARIKRGVFRLASLPTQRRNPFSAPPMNAPFELKVPDAFQDGWLFEWSPNPDLIPAAGWFGKGSVMRFDQEHWSQLSPGQHYGRLGRLKGWETHFVYVSWRVVDSTPHLECNAP